MRKVSSLLVVLALMLSIFSSPVTATTETSFTVVTKNGTVSESVLAAIAQAGGTVESQVDEIGALTVRTPNATAFVKAMLANGEVESVGPDLTVELPAADEPAANDGTSPIPFYDPSKYTWGVDRVTSNGAAWNITTGTKDVIVGIIDSGLDFSHPDLVANIVPGSKTFVPGTTNAWDQNSHGTHVAGTIAANVRIKGVAPNVGIRSYRVFGTGGASQSWITRAIIAAANDGMDVINMSLGGQRVTGQYYYKDAATGERIRLGGDAAANVAYHRAIQYAIRKNVTVIVAAGNDGQDLSNRNALTDWYNRYLDKNYGDIYDVEGATTIAPAQIPGVVTVSAMGGGFGTADRLAYYSNYGAGAISVTAPGGDIGPRYITEGKLDTDYYKYYTLSTVPTYMACKLPKSLFGDCNYGFKVGTSMATPHVTGVAALIIANEYAKTGVKPTPAQVATRLQQTTEDIGKAGYDIQFGHGLVNALKALSFR